MADLVKRLRFGGAGGAFRSVLLTAGTNSLAVSFSAIAGLLIARGVGPSGRGDYAAVMVWFGLMLVVGEFGQTAATTYHVARFRTRGRDVVATSRLIMLLVGSVVVIAVLLLAPIIGRGNEVRVDCLRLLAVGCLVAFMGAGYGFALQATNLAQWNATRLLQPFAFLAWVTALLFLGRLTVWTASVGVAVTMTAQILFSYVLCRRLELTRGRLDRSLVRPLVTYGGSQLAAAAPTTLNVRLDQLVLAQFATSASLGHYAVAISITSLANPFVGAVGSVLFPRLARSEATGAVRRREAIAALRVSLVLALFIVLVLGALTPWAVPLLSAPHSPRRCHWCGC